MWWNNGMGWGGVGAGGWVVMTILMLAFWALVVFGVVALFRGGRPTGSESGTTHEPSAEKVLDERFARGEINAEEYNARRTVLHATHRR